MLVGKQVADLITFSRAMLAFLLVWLGVTHGDTSLALITILMILNWTGDALDGTLARRSSRKYHTWIGDHDLEVDMLVSFGLLFYLLAAGFVDIRVLLLYSLIGVLIFWRWGFHRSLGMVIQAPIYGWFIWVAIRDQPTVGIWVIVWLIAAVVITWPRFPQQVIPGFLTGMKEVVNLRRKK
jgi:hypothetical protein